MTLPPAAATTVATGRDHPSPTPEQRRDWIALWRVKLAQAREETTARRARVLAHNDLAQRLTEPPVGYTQPTQWNGYVPPKLCPDPRPYRSAAPVAAPLNDSPRRAALVEICAEAMRREENNAR